MRVTEYDRDHRVPSERPEPLRLTFDPFRTVPLSRGSELRFDIATGPDRRSVSFRLFTLRDEDGRVKNQGPPIHLFGPHLDAIIAVLTEARDAIQERPAPVIVQHVAVCGTVDPNHARYHRDSTDPEHSHA